MTALTQRRSPGATIAAIVPADPKMPTAVSHALSRALEPVTGRGRYGEDDPGFAMTPPALSEADWRAAREGAAHFDALLAEPVTRDHLASWLMPVNAASRNPQGPQEFLLRVEGIASMLDDLPAAAFTHETRRRLATGFFPSHEDIRAVIQPVADTWQRKRDALRGLRKVEPQTRPAHQPPTPEERATILAKAAAAVADIRATAAQADPRGTRQVEARPVHPAALLAQYEALAADGNQAAATRAAQLRKALCAAQEGA